MRKAWLEYARGQTEGFGGSLNTSPEMGQMLRSEFGIRLSKPSYSATGLLLNKFDYWWTTRGPYPHLGIRVYENDRWEILTGSSAIMEVVATGHGAWDLREALVQQGVPAA